MRLKRLVLTALAVAAFAAPALGQNGILIANDYKPWPAGFDACMTNARKTLIGAGMVVEEVSNSIVVSNEDRTISIRCDIPGYVVMGEAYFPGEQPALGTIADAFVARRPSPLIPAEVKAHQYTAECTRQTSCRIDAAAICRQAYPTSAAPAAKVLGTADCLDAQGPFVCRAVYDLNCN